MAVVTAVQVAGSGFGGGSGTNPYFSSWTVTTTGTDTCTITHGLDLSNLVPAAGGNGTTPTTINQALKVTCTQVAGTITAANLGVTAIGTTTVELAATGAGTWRVWIERQSVNGQ